MTSKPGIISDIFDDKYKDCESLTKKFLKINRCLNSEFWSFLYKHNG